MIYAEVFGAETFSAGMMSFAEQIDPPDKWLEIVAERYVNRFLPDEFAKGGPGWPAVQRGGSPLMDTGKLAGSFSTRPVSGGIEVYTPKVQAAMMNFGANPLTPKNGKAFSGRYAKFGGPYLWIPIMDSPTERRGASPRKYLGNGNTFIAKSRNGNLICFEKVSTGTGAPKMARNKFASRIELHTPGRKTAGMEEVIRPLFLLKLSVTIPPREFLRFNDEAIKVCEDALSSYIDEHVTQIMHGEAA